jgi:tRNA (cmo5U34)-methyltransferase
MTTSLSRKSSTDEIRQRFDADVERFSNLETGQQAIIDAKLAMDLITRAAFASTPRIRRVLDIGCGAGNNTLKLLQLAPGFASDLVDLSGPMLERARERVTQAGANPVRTFQVDFRAADLEPGYDVILAAAVLHHLRDDVDWEAAFRKIYALLAPGGSVWITDMVFHEIPVVHDLMWQRYGFYLAELGGADYRDQVFAYIEKEDSPRPLTYQLDLLRRVGFSGVDVLHKNSSFAAFGGVKG